MLLVSLQCLLLLLLLLLLLDLLLCAPSVLLDLLQVLLQHLHCQHLVRRITHILCLLLACLQLLL